MCSHQDPPVATCTRTNELHLHTRSPRGASGGPTISAGQAGLSSRCVTGISEDRTSDRLEEMGAFPQRKEC